MGEAESCSVPSNHTVVRVVNVDARIVRRPTKGRILAVLVIASRKGTLIGFDIGHGGIGRRLRGGVDVAVVGDGVDRGRQVVRSSVNGRRRSADGGECRRQDLAGRALVINDYPGRVGEVIVVVAIARPETIGRWDGHGGAAEGESSAQDGPGVHGKLGRGWCDDVLEKRDK